MTNPRQHPEIRNWQLAQHFHDCLAAQTDWTRAINLTAQSDLTTLPLSAAEQEQLGLEGTLPLLDADAIDLAKRVSLSEFRLQEGFKTLYHQTVNGYSKEIKLQKAAEYLKYSDFSVSEIVYKIGFNSRSYFSQIFSKRFGMLPTDYRNKNSE